MAYKLVCYGQRPVMKLSPEKAYPPGAKQVFRIKDSEGQFSRDVIGLQDDEIPDGVPLLTQVMADGRPTGPAPPLREIRELFRHEFASLSDSFKELEDPPHYPVDVSPRLRELTAQVEKESLRKS